MAQDRETQIKQPTRSSGWEALFVETPGRSTGSWLIVVSTFPDVTIQWFLETTPHLQWPHRSGLAPDSLFSPAIGRGTWSLVHIYLSGTDIMPSQGDCQPTNTMFRMLHHDDVGRTEREPAVSIHNCCVQHIQANIGAFVQRKQHLWGRRPVSRCSHRRKRTSSITCPEQSRLCNRVFMTPPGNSGHGLPLA